jgi:glycosyltransferase involved in cell wall biosynthesis
MSAVLVDWLGRGGIAQTSEAWVRVLRDHGIEVTVITRAGRELAADNVRVANERRLRLLSHRGVAQLASRTIREQRPSVVIVQNYVVPLLERPVFAAAAAVGAKVIAVVHDHEHHDRSGGLHAGLRSNVQRAEVIVAHSHYVGDKVAAAFDRPVTVVPLPLQLGVLNGVPAAPNARDRDQLAVHFGILHKGYKGTDVIEALARANDTGWRFRVVGVGAPVDVPHLESRAEFLPAADLVAEVQASAVTVLPYKHATMSGAVVLAQALGSVVVSTAAGGVPEQVAEGTGIVLPVDAAPAAWRAALSTLADRELRASYATAAWNTAVARHEQFASDVTRLATT